MLFFSLFKISLKYSNAFLGLFKLLHAIPKRNIASKSFESIFTACLKHSYDNLNFLISNRELPKLHNESISFFFSFSADSKYSIAL